MIEKNIYKVSCDIKNCKNAAKYVLPIKGRASRMYICEHCLRAIAQDYNLMIVPKSPKNAIKKRMDENAQSIKGE